MQLRHISRCFGMSPCYIIFFDLDIAFSEEKPILILKEFYSFKNSCDIYIHFS